MRRSSCSSPILTCSQRMHCQGQGRSPRILQQHQPPEQRFLHNRSVDLQSAWTSSVSGSRCLEVCEQFGWKAPTLQCMLQPLAMFVAKGGFAELIVLECATACSGHYPCSGRMIQCQDASVPETILLDFVLFRSDACVAKKNRTASTEKKKKKNNFCCNVIIGQKGHTPARKREETTVTHVGKNWLTRKERSQVKRKHHPTSCREPSEA